MIPEVILIDSGRMQWTAREQEVPSEEKVDVCGLHVNALTAAEVLSRVLTAVRERRVGRQRSPLVIFSANVDMLVKASRDSAFARELNSADLLLADGVPLLWMARLLGSRLPERVAGSDLVPMLAAHSAANSFSLFFLGSAPGVAEKAAARLARENPGLLVAGTLSPPMGFEADPLERDRVWKVLHEASADVVLVGLGAPKQERWIVSERERVPAAALVAVGGTFDIIADQKRRAPVLLQRAGLEWAWRMAQEPRRLGRRYLIEDSAALVLFLRAIRRNVRLRGRP